MCSNIYEDTDRMVTVKQPKEDRHSRNLGTTILLIFIFMFQFNQYPKYLKQLLGYFPLCSASFAHSVVVDRYNLEGRLNYTTLLNTRSAGGKSAQFRAQISSQWRTTIDGGRDSLKIKQMCRQATVLKAERVVTRAEIRQSQVASKKNLQKNIQFENF